MVITPKWLPTRLNREANRAVRQLTQIIDRIIQLRRESKEDTGDLLSMLLHAQDEDGSRMTAQQLRDEARPCFWPGMKPRRVRFRGRGGCWRRINKVEEKFHAELDRVLAGTHSDSG